MAGADDGERVRGVHRRGAQWRARAGASGAVGRALVNGSVGFAFLVGMGIALLWAAVPFVGFCLCDKVLISPVIIGVPLVATLIGALAILAGGTAAPALLLAASLATIATSWVMVAGPPIGGEWWPTLGLFFFFAPGALLLAAGCLWQMVRPRP